MEIDIEFRRITTFQRSFFFILAVEYGVRTCKRAGKESVRLSVRFMEGGGGGGGIFGVPCDVCCPASFSCGILQVSIG